LGVDVDAQRLDMQVVEFPSLAEAIDILNGSSLYGASGICCVFGKLEQQYFLLWKAGQKMEAERIIRLKERFSSEKPLPPGLQPAVASQPPGAMKSVPSWTPLPVSGLPEGHDKIPPVLPVAVSTVADWVEKRRSDASVEVARVPSFEPPVVIQTLSTGPSANASVSAPPPRLVPQSQPLDSRRILSESAYHGSQEHAPYKISKNTPPMPTRSVVGTGIITITQEHSREVPRVVDEPTVRLDPDRVKTVKLDPERVSVKTHVKLDADRVGVKTNLKLDPDRVHQGGSNPRFSQRVGSLHGSHKKVDSPTLGSGSTTSATRGTLGGGLLKKEDIRHKDEVDVTATPLLGPGRVMTLEDLRQQQAIPVTRNISPALLRSPIPSTKAEVSKVKTIGERGKFLGAVHSAKLQSESAHVRKSRSDRIGSEQSKTVGSQGNIRVVPQSGSFSAAEIRLRDQDRTRNERRNANSRHFPLIAS
jgi:hypothetical protein